MNRTANSPRAVFLLYGLILSLVFLTAACVTYESSLNRRYGYNTYPQQQPYYTPPNNQGYTPNYNPSYNPNNAPNQNFGQNPSQWNAQQQFGAPPITFQTFYDELAPYGEWINTPQFGFVWRPFGIDAGWRPYLNNGRWVYTNFGWTWISDYAWGWAPFHYGRWQLDPFYGWVWHPGNVWGPAWVEWRFWNGHYCWVPLAPGINLGIGFRGGDYHWSAWNVVPCRFFTAPNLWNHCLPYSQTHTFIRNTTFINNTVVVNNNTYYTGPTMNDVERYSGKVIPMALKGLNKVASSTINDNTITMYRPDVEDYTSKTQSNAFRPATATPANQATTGKAAILLNETPENADRIASPKANPLAPNSNRDASDPMLMPPTGKTRPSGLGEESGSGGKVIPMPAPADDRKSNPWNTPPSGGNSGGGVDKSRTKPVEQEQRRDVPPAKSSPAGMPYTKPQQQPQAEPPKKTNDQPQPYKKQINDDQEQQREAQRQEEQRQEQQRQEQQQRYRKQAEEQQREAQRQEQQRQEEEQRQEQQQRYRKQAEEQQQREAQRQEQQRQEEQQRYRKQAEEQQQREAQRQEQQRQEEQQREAQRQEEQQRYRKQTEEQQQREEQRREEQRREEQRREEQRREEQQRKESEVKKNTSSPEQSIPKKKGDDEQQY